MEGLGLTALEECHGHCIREVGRGARILVLEPGLEVPGLARQQWGGPPGRQRGGVDGDRKRPGRASGCRLLYKTTELAANTQVALASSGHGNERLGISEQEVTHLVCR